jgi:hypothetical protein
MWAMSDKGNADEHSTGTAQRAAGRKDRASGSIRVFVLCAVIMAACAWAARAWFGSWDLAVAYALGERLLASPREVDGGEFRSGEGRELSFWVINWTGEEVRFVGSSTSCACAVVADLPFTLPAGERRRVEVRLKPVAGQRRALEETVFLFTDSPFKKILPVRLHGSVIPADQGEKAGEAAARGQ